MVSPAAVGGHGVHGKEELICYFLVAHTFGNAADNVFFSLAKGLGFVSLLLNASFGNTDLNSVFLQLLLNSSDRRHEQIVLYETMRSQIVLTGNHIVSRQRVLSADDDIPDLETLDQRTVEALVLKSFDAESFEAEVRESKLFGR